MTTTTSRSPRRILPKGGFAASLFGYCTPKKPMLPYRHMALLQGVLPIVQIILAFLLIGAILLQRTGASLGGAFGADNFSSGFHTRRGLEKTLFTATIVLGVLLALSALVALVENVVA